jgi:Protein of unknown function, DUF481
VSAQPTHPLCRRIGRPEVAEVFEGIAKIRDFAECEDAVGNGVLASSIGRGFVDLLRAIGLAALVGAGYRIIKSDTRNLTVDGAVGAETESNKGTGRSSSGAIKAGENFDTALSPMTKVTEKLTGIWKTNDFGDALYHFDAGLATTIATHAELKFAYVYDYKSRTAPSIKKGDSALFAALLFKF